MNDKTALFFVNIANRFGFDRSSLLFFGSETTKLIEKYSKTLVEDIPRLAKVDPKELFDEWHYSWLIQAIEPLPDSTKQLCTAVLSAKMAYPLLKHFKLSAPRKISSPFMKEMILHYLLQKSAPKLPTPKLLLPKSFFNQILDFSKNQLETLFDQLGLYDLASELQEIVDKNVYLKIFHHLTPGEKEVLLEILARKQLWALPKLGMNAWFKDPSFRYVLQKRGILRFCVGISGMSTDFLWHLTHKLDTRRAHMLNQMVKPTAITPATSIVKEQIRLTIEKMTHKMESV